jgi:hypothetical protein
MKPRLVKRKSRLVGPQNPFAIFRRMAALCNGSRNAVGTQNNEQDVMV